MEESKNKLIVYDSAAIQRKIYTIRDAQVMFDSDLAAFYGVETKFLNRAVKRNIDRFPKEFMFMLNIVEWDSLRYQNGTSKSERGGRRYLPYVFTEQGIAMLSDVLRSIIAVKNEHPEFEKIIKN